MSNEILFTCEFCKKPFKSERGFVKHNCTQKKRERLFLSLEGKMAWGYFKSWMKEKHTCSVPKSATFKTSRYFKSFYEFALFVKKSKIPDTQAFISLMIKNSIAPPQWIKTNTYGIYLSYITKNLPVRALEKITIDTLFDVADAGEVNISKVFDILTPNEIIQLLHQRRLFPWVLLKSKKFADFVMNNTNTEERIIMENLINPDYWNKRFKNNPKDVEKVKQYINELGL